MGQHAVIKPPKILPAAQLKKYWDFSGCGHFEVGVYWDFSGCGHFEVGVYWDFSGCGHFEVGVYWDFSGCGHFEVGVYWDFSGCGHLEVGVVGSMWWSWCCCPYSRHAHQVQSSSPSLGEDLGPAAV